LVYLRLLLLAVDGSADTFSLGALSQRPSVSSPIVPSLSKSWPILLSADKKRFQNFIVNQKYQIILDVIDDIYPFPINSSRIR